MYRSLVAAAFLIACTACPVPVWAQAAPAEMTQHDPDIVDIIFTELEKRIIRDYYDRNYREWAARDRAKGKSKDLPPGLARKETLPPGLAQQLVRKGTLPPGLAGRSLPYDLVLRLPPRPDWQDIVIVDDKVLLIQRATNLILDILLVAAAEAAD